MSRAHGINNHRYDDSPLVIKQDGDVLKTIKCGNLCPPVKHKTRRKKFEDRASLDITFDLILSRRLLTHFIIYIKV